MTQGDFVVDVRLLVNVWKYNEHKIYGERKV